MPHPSEVADVQLVAFLKGCTPPNSHVLPPQNGGVTQNWDGHISVAALVAARSMFLPIRGAPSLFPAEALVLLVHLESPRSQHGEGKVPQPLPGRGNPTGAEVLLAAWVDGFEDEPNEQVGYEGTYFVGEGF